MTERILPAIMSGGAGTRLWPTSTDLRPKQFHALTGPDTMFVETLRRASGQAEGLTFLAPIILSGSKYAELVDTHLRAANVQAQAVVLEPCARNTAAAAAVAAALAQETAPDALVLLTPADHVVTDRPAFLAALARAAPLARERVVTFGITPDRPDTGYGYIKRSREIADGVFEIDAFKEKPDAKTATDYLTEGGYSWNAGMFLFRPKLLLEEFTIHAPAILEGALKALENAVRRGSEIALEPAAFAATPAQPLDIAVMEKTSRGAVAPCTMGWADVGSWSEIWRLSPRDAAGNALQGAAAAIDAHNNILRGDGVKVCVAGVSDLIVVATADAVIVLPRDRAQDVKLLIEAARALD